VCEKPLAMTSAQSAELLEVAERSGRIHAVNFNLRFYATNQHVHGMIANHELGEVRLVSGHYLQDWLLLDTDWNWRLEPQLGGELRAVADIGSHWMDLTSFLVGRRITGVMADLTTFIKIRHQPTGPVETFATASDAKTVARDPHRGRRDDLAPLRGRSARRRHHLAAQPRPQELARVPDRRLELSRVVELRKSGRALDRASRQAQRATPARPGDPARGGPEDGKPPRRPGGGGRRQPPSRH